MKLITNGAVCFLLSSAIVCGSVFASGAGNKYRYKDDRIYKDASAASQDRFRIIAAGGIAKLNGGNSQLGVTSSETDTLVQTNSNNWNTPAAQLGRVTN